MELFLFNAMNPNFIFFPSFNFFFFLQAEVFWASLFIDSEATRSAIQNINDGLHVCQEMEKHEGADTAST